MIIVGATILFEIYRKVEDARITMEYNGTIEVVEIDLSSKIGGRVLGLPKAEGEDVVKGEVVAELEYDELSAQKNSAKANLENSRKNYERAKSLYAKGAISQSDYDNARTAFDVATAAFDQISANITNALITSPVSGTVLTANLEVGEMAFPGTPVVTVADLSRPWIYVYVKERELGLVKIGRKAYATVDSYPDKKFSGKVVSISNKAEFTPKTIQTKDERVKLVFRVKVALDNSGGELKPGMPADVVIEEKSSDDQG